MKIDDAEMPAKMLKSKIDDEIVIEMDPSETRPVPTVPTFCQTLLMYTHTDAVTTADNEAVGKLLLLQVSVCGDPVVQTVSRLTMLNAGGRTSVLTLTNGIGGNGKVTPPSNEI